MRLEISGIAVIRYSHQLKNPFNVGFNMGKVSGAGIDEHLHFHIVPRWIGDVNFMPIVGETKVIVQGLYDTYDLLKPKFDLLNK